MVLDLFTCLLVRHSHYMVTKHSPQEVRTLVHVLLELEGRISELVWLLSVIRGN